jgi:hypothetical protein
MDLNTLPLITVEELKRQVGDDQRRIRELLPQVLSGRLKHSDLRRLNKDKGAPSRAKSDWFEQAVLDALKQRWLLPDLGLSADTEVLAEPHTPVFTPDAVLVDKKTGSLALIEMKDALTRRSFSDTTNQVLAYASLGNTAWLFLRVESESFGTALLERLGKAGVANVGLVLLSLDAMTVTARRVVRPREEAKPDGPRQEFRKLLLRSRPDLADRGPGTASSPEVGALLRPPAAPG